MSFTQNLLCLCWTSSAHIWGRGGSTFCHGVSWSGLAGALMTSMTVWFLIGSLEHRLLKNVRRSSVDLIVEERCCKTAFDNLLIPAGISVWILNISCQQTSFRNVFRKHTLCHMFSHNTPQHHRTAGLLVEKYQSNVLNDPPTSRREECHQHNAALRTKHGNASPSFHHSILSGRNDCDGWWLTPLCWTNQSSRSVLNLQQPVFLFYHY